MKICKFPQAVGLPCKLLLTAFQGQLYWNNVTIHGTPSGAKLSGDMELATSWNLRKEDERFWQKPQKWFLYGKMMTTSMFVSLLQHGWFLDEIVIASSSNFLSTTQFKIIYRTSQDIQRADGFRHDLWLSIHPYKCKDDSSPVYPDGMHI